jgi:hypothetical protein
MSELLSAIMTALKESQPGVPEQQVQMMTSMRILGGDWTPFDTIQPQLKAYVEKVCNGNPTEEAIRAMANGMADDVRAKLSASSAVNEVFANHLKDIAPEETDVYTLIFNTLNKHLPITLGLCVKPEEGGKPFSTSLKDSEIEMVGELFEAVEKITNNGNAGLQAMLRAFSQKGSAEVMAKYPQHAQAAMFGLPMVLNMMNQFHAEYRKRHNIAAPAAATS